MRRLTSVGSVSPSPRRAFRPLLRPRISLLLDSAYQYPVTVLIAGAGYGKSVALEHWLAGKPETVVRYNVREGTRGVFDFTLGLAEALAPVLKIGAKSAANAVNAAEKSERPESDLANWFQNVLRKFSGTVVIDDFHVAAGEDPAVGRMIAHLVDRDLQNIRWVIASRAACALPITSWIAYGKSQMAIGERELAFTLDEAHASAAGVDAEFAQPHLNELYAYTAGWPTALSFALLSSQRTFDLEELRATTRQLSYQFLAEQVLLTLSPADVDFLLDTAVYDRIDPGVLDAAGFAEPRKRFQFLRENGTFIINEASGSVRYHDLFRDFLRSELAKDDARYRRAWENAGRTYELLADWLHALDCYETIEGTGDILRILNDRGFALIEHGNRRGVLRALARVPQIDRLHAYPEVIALRANCEANTGNIERANVWYREAILHAKDALSECRLRAEFARDLIQRGDAEAVNVLEAGLDADIPPALRVTMQGRLAIAYWQSARKADALATIERARVLAAPIDDPELHAILLHQIAYLQASSGNMREAANRSMEALDLARACALHSLCARIQMILYYVNSVAENVSEALWWTKQMERSAREAGDTMLLFSALISTYELEVERGNLDALPKLAEQLRHFEQNRFERTSAVLLPSFAMQAAWQKQFDESVRILGNTERESASTGRNALRAAEIALYAAAAGSRERSEEAASFAQEQLRVSDPIEPLVPKRLAKTLVFTALSQLLLGKFSSANRLIAEAERISGDVGERTRTLISVARSMFVHVETRMLDDEVNGALTALQDSGYGGLARMLQALPMPSMSRTGTGAVLTKTELEVLRAIASAGDSKAAAAALGRSTHTIDWHVKSILKKLRFTSRREAVLFARNQGLIK